jgi:hypothetical protein
MKFEIKIIINNNHKNTYRLQDDKRAVFDWQYRSEQMFTTKTKELQFIPTLEKLSDAQQEQMNLIITGTLLALGIKEVWDPTNDCLTILSLPSS